MMAEEPARPDIVKRMKNLHTEYTRRERIQDAIVEFVFRVMREVAEFARWAGRRRRP